MDDEQARFRLPAGPAMADRARQIASGDLPPVAPRDAATVIVVRPGTAGRGVEVLLLQRTRALDFAPGACVFPGGSVDEQDADPAILAGAWSGPSPDDLAATLGIPAQRACALAVAAVRETFEESGVLLASPAAGQPAPDTGALAEDQHALLSGSLTLGELLRRRHLVLRADLLTPWTRWITPEASPRRFDTWFFAAALPPGQLAVLTAASAGESDSVTWWGACRRPGGGPGQDDHRAAADRGHAGRADPLLRRGRHRGRAPGHRAADVRRGDRGRAGLAGPPAGRGVPAVTCRAGNPNFSRR